MSEDDGEGRPRVGVVAYQGDVPEHLAALRRAGADAVEVRSPEDLEELDGLVIPGGESTTIGDAMETWGLMEATRRWAKGGGSIWGTCAGGILLAEEIAGGRPDQPRLGLVPMEAERNGFGRQVDSCEVQLDIDGIEGDPFETVFIRAPFFRPRSEDIEVLAEFEGRVVALRCGRHLVTAFHPELTDDLRVHRLFLARLERDSG